MKVAEQDIKDGLKELGLDAGMVRTELAKLASPRRRVPATPMEVITAPHTLAPTEEVPDAELE